jgi:FAD:protein FMN transferase
MTSSSDEPADNPRDRDGGGGGRAGGPLRLACEAMGARFEVALFGGGSGGGDDPARLRAAGEAAVAEINHWHERLSFFEASSFISYINERAANHPVPCDGDMFRLLLLCRDVWRDSQGAFDPTVAALMRAAGFREMARDPAAIADALSATGFQHVTLDESNHTIRFAHRGIELDLGAIGKGWALDRAADILRQVGITSALIHGGTSSVIAIGSPPDAAAWRISLRAPDADLSAPVITLLDSALGVSAPHGRVVDLPGGSAGHVLDPRTGQSAAKAALAAVIGDSAAAADAWSTALLVLATRPRGLPDDLTTVLALKGPKGPFWDVKGPNSRLVRTS